MKSVIRVITLLVVLIVTQSCKDVSFSGKKGDGSVGDSGCTGPNCAPPPCSGPGCSSSAFAWFESGFGLCSKPCGSGNQTQTVECRRTSDNVAVPESSCNPPKPDAVRVCNIQACTTTYTWNIGPYGQCSKSCGTGTRTRTVVCQDQSGNTVADNLCSQPKPTTSDTCNTDSCGTATYSWAVTPGRCSKDCGGGTATDVVVCKKNDGTVVADTFCDAGTKPPTSRTCNTQDCPPGGYTYSWEPGAWSACSKDCGDGLQTRSVTCKRNDGVYVAADLCNAATKPAVQQPCKIKDCPTGRQVTQTAYVTPASNSVDVILIIDDSASMKEDQAKLASRMAGLLNELDAAKIDYQVCLTTTDIGYYKGSPIRWKGPETFIMTKNTPNKNTVFMQTIDALGAQWSSDEQGIKAMYLMIKDFRAAGCIRPQATLTTILVSDENERSVGGNRSWSEAQYQPLTPENYPDTLINFVKSEFDTTTFKKPFIWNSIIVKPGDTVCEAIQDAQSSPSFFGTLYAELSTKTKGYIGSICDSDYSQNLSYIKERTVNSMPGLTLECTPISAPQVTFDPQVTTSITVQGNQLKFNPAIPENVKITVSYTCPQ
jgi:hypothetical protein